MLLRGLHACAAAGAVALAEEPLLAQLSAAQPVVDAVGRAGAGAEEVYEEDPVDELGPLPEELVAEEDPVHQEERDHPHHPGPPADHEEDRGDVEEPPLGPPGEWRVPEEEQRVLLAFKEEQQAVDVEEALGVVADTIAVALELAGREDLTSDVCEKDALVGEEHLEVLPEVVDVADREEREGDPEEGDRPRVFHRQPEPPEAVALDDEHREHADRAEDHAPTHGRREGDRVLVRDSILEERKCRKCGRSKPKHRCVSVGNVEIGRKRKEHPHRCEMLNLREKSAQRRAPHAPSYAGIHRRGGP